MATLSTQRSARDLWISRSHLLAASLAVLSLAGVCFASGLSIGRAQATASGPSVVEGAAPEGELLDLIARVEANAQIGGGVDKLTFPDALAGRAGAVTLPGPIVATASAATIEPRPGDVVPVDVVPEGAHPVEVARFAELSAAAGLRDGLRGAGLSAWLGLELVAGQRVHTVLVEPTE